MGKKIREQNIEQWLSSGDVQQLNEHWLHPMVTAYRKKAIADTTLYPKKGNDWCNGVRNGNTFSFLMQHDSEFNKANANISQPEVWFSQFKKTYQCSWGLLDIASGELQGANAVDTLDLLMRVNQACYEEYAHRDTVSMVCSKLYDEMHGFYRRFQQQGALTAIAWMENDTIGFQKRPQMANIMRHAASHYPNDVLGAYLVWACNAGCKSVVHEKQDQVQNGARIERLRLLAGRVGLDTQSYEEHAYQCKTLYEGLGMELNGKNILAYVQGTTMTAAPLAAGDELGALFL